MNITKNTKGFSMIEMLVAVLLLTVGILALAGVMPLASRGSVKSSLESRAIELAQQNIEYLRSLRYTDADLTAGTHATENVEGMQRWWVVTDNTPTNNVKKVRVFVRHPTIERDITITTYMINNNQ